MRYSHFTIFIFAILAFQSNAIGFNYQAAIRLSDGKAISNTDVRLKASIINDINDENPIYSEDHFTNIDNRRLINITIGEGVASLGEWNNIDWSKSLYLKTVAIINENEYILGVSSILGVPKAIHSTRTNKLVSKSSDGTSWELKVNDVGDLNWVKLNDNPAEGVYPKEKWPNELYLVGSFSNWDIDNAKRFNKLSEGKFGIQCKLSPGDVIKFTKVRSWNSDIDWSGTTGAVNRKESLKEWGNTPEFEGETNTYMILVDFTTYTLRIYLLQ